MQQLYFVRFAAYNTGIFLFYTQITAVSSSIQINRKKGPYPVAPAHEHPLFSFAARDSSSHYGN